MRNYYKFDSLFYDTILSFVIPTRKIGTIFKFNKNKYKVVKCDFTIGCINEDSDKNKELCAFCNNCNSISILKRGFCTKNRRKDKNTVYFKLLN